MYIYNIINKFGNLERILSPFVIKKGLINDNFLLISSFIKKINLEIDKCKLFYIALDRNDNILNINPLDNVIKLEKENEFVITIDYRSFIIYTMNDRYEYCSYCDVIANKVLDNCHICHRKKCGSCEDFENICNYCDTNIII